MAELTYFDVHAQYGARPFKPMQERWSLQHLLEDMDLCGIAGALVRHTQAQFYEPMHGNRRLLAEIEPHRDRLYPCWAVVPDTVGNFPAPDDFVQEMADHDVRAAVIYPKSCAIPIAPALLHPLADALAPRAIPLLVSYTELGGYDAAHRFLRILDASPVIFTDISWAQWREIQLLMDLHDNLHIEFGTFQANRVIEWFGGRFGFGRCLFGSHWPHKTPGAARAMLDWRLCSDDDAQKVASGNLTRLLRGAGPTAPPKPGAFHDSLTAEQRAGEPLSTLTLDAHCHVLHDGLDYAGERYVMLKGDAQGMLELTHRMGVDVTALMSWNGTVGMDAAAGNVCTLEAVQQAPEEYFGLVTLNPTHQDEEEMQAEIRTYHLEHGFWGLKPYQRTTIPYNHAKFDPWWRFGNKHHLYGLFHISVGGIDAVIDIAERYPDFSCLIAHSGSSWPFADQVVNAMKRCPNIYAELTYTAVLNGVVEYLAGECGADRVLFGTDAPMRDPRPQLGWCVFARLSEGDKKLVVGGNFRRILSQARLPGHKLPARVLG